jgi:hypothetical protein
MHAAVAVLGRLAILPKAVVLVALGADAILVVVVSHLPALLVEQTERLANDLRSISNVVTKSEVLRRLDSTVAILADANLYGLSFVVVGKQLGNVAPTL